MNFRKTLLHRVSSKALFLTTIIALAAIAAVALAFVPSLNGTSKAAVEKVSQLPGDEIATAEMLKNALNFRSAAGYQVLAADSSDVDGRAKKDLYDMYTAVTQLPCTQLGDSQLGGKSFAPGVYCLDSANLASQMTLDGAGDSSAIFVFLVRGDLTANAGAGIALANEARSANAFFVAGDSAKIGSGIEFNANLVARRDVNVDDASTVRGRMVSVAGKVNGAVLSNLGGGTGTIQICKTTAPNTVDISNRFYRFTVSGVAGVIEVFVPPTPVGSPTGLSTGCSGFIDVPVGPQVITELPEARLPNNALFVNFQLINVEQLNPSFPSPAGSSSLGVVNLGARTAAINVVEGGAEGVLITRWTNTFAIVGYVEICKHRATGPAQGTATFGFSAQTYNPPGTGTIPGGGDPDVTGTFNFTVEGVYSLNQLNAPSPTTGSVTTTRTYQVFSVPVGLCSGPIAVTVSNPPPTPTTVPGAIPPYESVVRVTEIARPGFFLEAVRTRPTCDREVQDTTNMASTPVVCPFPAAATNQNPFIPGAIPATEPFIGGGSMANGGEVLGSRVNPPTAIVAAGPNAPRGTVTADNVGGGYATVRVIAGSAALETIVDFFNRSNPGVVKVCKIAGPGIPLGTLFRFSVFGPYGAQNTNPPQTASYGPVSTIVDVTAGDPATGGNCVIVPGLGAGAGRAEFQTYINGTPVLVVENGISPLNTIPVPPGAIRVARIRVLGPATGALVLQSGTGANRAGFTPNQCAGFGAAQNCNGLASGDVTPDPAGFDGRNPGNVTPVITPRIGRVAFTQRPGEVIAEFTNFIFNPTILKICKVASGGLAPGGSFNFTVTLNSPVGLGGALFPGSPTATTSVISAAPAGANNFANCAVVDGGTFPGGQFNVGSSITVTEAAAAGSAFVRCETPTSGGGLTQGTPATRACTLSGPEGVVAGTTVLAFVNGPTTPAPPEAGTAFDFDGDGRADASIFRPSTGMWSFAASSAGNDVRSTRWGTEGDVPVSADYDGDGRYDYAVFRPSTGAWHIVGSTDGARSVPFGMSGDIPQPGDYDGDGKADAAVFRPSNGTWYMLGSRDGFSAVQFGVSTDRPVAADYDGDGKTDQAVYRAGAWYMNKSREGFSGVNWGVPSDTPVPADYDGNGKADVAVYRNVEGNGFWFALKADGGYTAVNWGKPSDRPVPADYDGDGKADIAVYRGGMWYSLPSANAAQGFATVVLGNDTDTPVPAPLQ